MSKRSLSVMQSSCSAESSEGKQSEEGPAKDSCLDSGPLVDWHLYFAGESRASRHKMERTIRAVVHLLSNEGSSLLSDALHLMNSYLVPRCGVLSVLLPYGELHKVWSKHKLLGKKMKDGKTPICPLVQFMRNNPFLFFPIVSFAAYNVLKRATGHLQLATEWKVRARVVELLPHFEADSVSDLNAECVDVFVRVNGRLSKEQPIYCVFTEADFECAVCGLRQHKVFLRRNNYAFSPPSVCTNEEFRCKSRTFALKRDLNCKRIDRQRFTLECATKGSAERSSVVVELTEDLCGKLQVGDYVAVTGVVTHSLADDSELVLAVNWMEPMSACKTAPRQMAALKSDAAAVASFFRVAKAKKLNIFDRLAASLCPAVYEIDDSHTIGFAKMGLLLSLFGGSESGKGSEGFRETIHVLLCGEPGLGKSMLLRATLTLSPNGVDGSSATAAGLTVCVDSSSQNCDAGAALLADSGHLVIDELDKMKRSALASLLEVCSTQTVSVSKAAVVANFPVTTTLVAACNPRHSKYRREKTIAENLKLSPALLSRFDLIFLLLESQQSDGRSTDAMYGSLSSALDTPQTSQSNTAMQRRMQAAATGECLSQSQLKWLIAFARGRIQPQLTAEASKVLTDFYVQLRSTRQRVDSTPITARQMHAMVRMAKARAKAELRRSVCRNDALEVVEIMKRSLVSVMANSTAARIGEEATAHLAFDRGITRHYSRRGQLRELKKQLKRYKEEMGESISEVKFKDFMTQTGVKSKDYQNRIDSLNQMGDLLERADHMYKINI